MKASEKYAVGKEIEIVNLESGNLERGEITAQTTGNFKKFAGVIVKFESGNYQECDREFLS